MKDWWNKQLAIKAFYLFLALAATIVFALIIYNIGAVFGFLGALIGAVDAFIIGFAVAYILNPSYMFFREKVFGKIFKEKRWKLAKVFSILTLYLLVAGLIVLLIWLVVPQFIQSIVECVNNFVTNYDSYYKTVNDFIKSFGGDDTMLSGFVNSVSNTFLSFLKGINTSEILKITSVAGSVVSTVFSILIGVIVSIYMLYNKEKFCAQIKKTGYALLSKKTMYRLQRGFGRSHAAFGQYLTGVLIDALIVGTEFTVLCLIFQIPYAPLIGVVLGLTNMIPFFGPYIGGVPCAIIVLVVTPWKAFLLIGFMVLVQQIDANLVAPKIIGQKTGLEAIWVVFAILVGGSFFGVIGMLVAVPVFSVIYLFFKDMICERLRKKNMSDDTADYLATADVAEKYKDDED